MKGVVQFGALLIITSICHQVSLTASRDHSSSGAHIQRNKRTGQRLPPGVNNGAVDLTAVNPRSIDELLRAGTDLGITDERGQADLCQQMFKQCANATLLDSLVSEGANCFHVGGYKTRSLWLDHTTKCGQRYGRTMRLKSCETQSGDENSYYTCLGQEAGVVLSSGDMFTRIIGEEIHIDGLNDNSLRMFSRAFADSAREPNGRIDLVTSVVIIGIGLAEHLQRSDIRKLQTNLDDMTTDNVFAAFGDMKDLRRQYVRLTIMPTLTLDPPKSKDSSYSAEELDSLKDYEDSIALLSKAFGGVDDNTIRHLSSGLVYVIGLTGAKSILDDKSKSEMAAFVLRARKYPYFKISAMLRYAGSINSMTRSEMASLRINSILDGIDVATSNDVSLAKMRQLARHEYTTVMQNRDFSEYAPLFRGISLRIVQDANAFELVGSLKANPYAINSRRAFCDVFRQSMADIGLSACSLVSYGVSSCLSDAHLRGCTSANMGLHPLAEATSGATFAHTVTPLVAKIMVKAYQSEVGFGPEEDTYEEFYAAANIRNAPCVFAQGATDDFLNAFSDLQIPGIMEAMSEGNCDIHETPRMRLTRRVSNIRATLSAMEQEQCAGFLGGRLPSEHRKLPVDSQCSLYERDIAVLSTVDVTVLTQIEIKKAYNRIKSIRCIDGVKVDMRSGAITDEMVDELGSLVTGVPNYVIRRLKDTRATALVQDSMNTHSSRASLSLTTRNEFASKLQDLISRIELDNVDTYACSVPDFLAMGGVVTDEAFFASSTLIIDCINSDRRAIKRRLRSGLTVDALETVNIRYDSAVDLVLDALSRTTESDVFEYAIPVSPVKKREVRSLDCETVEILDLSVVDVPAEVLRTLEQNFVECVSTLGTVEDWSSEQLTVLKELAQQSFGYNSSQWDTADIIDLGSIAASLDESEMAALTIDVDAVEALGAFDIYSTAQLEAMFENYLGDGDGSELLSLDLVSLGEFVCGASTDVIANIDKQQYLSAASSLGLTRSCDAERMAAFIALAKDDAVFGPVSEWSELQVQTLGNMVGGMTPHELGLFGQTQIESILPISFAFIPPSVVSGLTAAQIYYMSMTQLHVFTDDQEQAMSNDVLGLLHELLGTAKVQVEHVEVDAGEEKDEKVHVVKEARAGDSAVTLAPTKISEYYAENGGCKNRARTWIIAAISVVVYSFLLA